ncbi:hypothetical protein MferCBS31731_003152 [Microsporum ferrugineum]
MSMSTLRRFFWLGALLSATLQVSALPTAQDQSCNGHPEYCDRRYSELSFVGAHNSPFVGPLLQHNQDISVSQQLDFGIRFLQGQTHKNDDGVFSMCHTSCLLEDAGSVSSYLQTVKAWLDGHPDEVVTLLITNGDGLDIKEFDDAFNTVGGIKDYTFAPKSKLALGDWPTLRELIKTGKRLIVFVDSKADTNRFPYLLDEFSYYFETPFSTTDENFPQCTLDRPAGGTPDGRMYLVNHTLNVNILGIFLPDRFKAGRTNAAVGQGSIGAQVDLCNSIYHRKPNVVLLDFITEGDVLKAERTMNGL